MYLQTNFHIDWDVPWVKGLSLRGLGSYYIADELENNQEYTYVAYTYVPATDSTDENYKPTGGSTNPWSDREQIKHINTDIQLQANYNNTFGEHTIGATVVAERIKNHYLRNWLHASPHSNNLPLVYYNIMDQYQDADQTEARIGYIGRITYNYANRYFIEGFWQGVMHLTCLLPVIVLVIFPVFLPAGELHEEPFFKSLLNNKTNILTDLKFRGSYGQLGDDRNPNDLTQPIVPEFAYLQGYNYGYRTGIAILDGNTVTASRDKGFL